MIEIFVNESKIEGSITSFKRHLEKIKDYMALFGQDVKIYINQPSFEVTEAWWESKGMADEKLDELLERPSRMPKCLAYEPETRKILCLRDSIEDMRYFAPRKYRQVNRKMLIEREYEREISIHG